MNDSQSLIQFRLCWLVGHRWLYLQRPERDVCGRCGTPAAFDTPTYAHWHGWRRASLFGAAYGLFLGGLAWTAWRTIALASPPYWWDFDCALLFAVGVFVALGSEDVERIHVRRGAENLGVKE